MQETQETWVPSLSQEDPLEEEMATHSSTLAWRIPWTEEPDGLQSMGLQRVGHDWVTEHTYVYLYIHTLCVLVSGEPWLIHSSCEAGRRSFNSRQVHQPVQFPSSQRCCYWLTGFPPLLWWVASSVQGGWLREPDLSWLDQGYPDIWSSCHRIH